MVAIDLKWLVFKCEYNLRRILFWGVAGGGCLALSRFFSRPEVVKNYNFS